MIRKKNKTEDREIDTPCFVIAGPKDVLSLDGVLASSYHRSPRRKVSTCACFPKIPRPKVRESKYNASTERLALVVTPSLEVLFNVHLLAFVNKKVTGIILKNEIQVCCDTCQAVIIDWCCEQVISYPGLPIPRFDYKTGEIIIDHHETLCDKCLLVRVQELEVKGIRFEKDEEGLQIIMPVPKDYIPPKPSWWEKFKKYLSEILGD